MNILKKDEKKGEEVKKNDLQTQTDENFEIVKNSNLEGKKYIIDNKVNNLEIINHDIKIRSDDKKEEPIKQDENKIDSPYIVDKLVPINIIPEKPVKKAEDKKNEMTKTDEIKSYPEGKHDPIQQEEINRLNGIIIQLIRENENLKKQLIESNNDQKKYIKDLNKDEKSSEEELIQEEIIFEEPNKEDEEENKEEKGEKEENKEEKEGSSYNDSYIMADEELEKTKSKKTKDYGFSNMQFELINSGERKENSGNKGEINDIPEKTVKKTEDKKSEMTQTDEIKLYPEGKDESIPKEDNDYKKLKECYNKLQESYNDLGKRYTKLCIERTELKDKTDQFDENVKNFTDLWLEHTSLRKKHDKLLDRVFWKNDGILKIEKQNEFALIENDFVLKMQEEIATLKKQIDQLRNENKNLKINIDKND